MSSPLSLAPLLAPPTAIDRELSRLVGRHYRTKLRDCYWNCLRAVEVVPHAAYVEGFVVVENAILSHIEHAWLETSDGVVLDPTPRFYAREADRATYFPALRWSLPETWTLLAAHGNALTTPLATYRPFSGKRETAWRDAALAAARHRSALALARWGTPDFAGDDEGQALRAVLGVYWVDGDPTTDEVGGAGTTPASRHTASRPKGSTVP